MEDIGRMLFCGICGAHATCGFGVTLDGLRMGDVGDWRCSDHHPHIKIGYTREEWAQARAEGNLYPHLIDEVLTPLNPQSPTTERAARC